MSDHGGTGEVRFREEQHYASAFLVVALSVLALVGLALAVVAALSRLNACGSDDASLWTFLPAIALVVALPLAFAFSRLVTEVTVTGVRVRLAPWQPHGREVRWGSVVRFAAVTYRPLRDYGGWGIRGTRRHGAYNARGDRGVFLELAGGATFVVGSQEPLELESAIAAACGRESARGGDGLARAERWDLVT